MEERLEFWNNRANLGFQAGSNDHVLKNIEIDELKKYLSHGQKILEIGCGNGITAIEIIKDFKVDILAVDYSDEMIKSARNLSDNKIFKGNVRFEVQDIRNIEKIKDHFDLIISERVLINLDNYLEQLDVLNKLYELVNPGGKFLMCESSKSGLENINKERIKFGLEKIEMPWHNNYIDDKKIENDLSKIKFNLNRVNNFTSTYYFLSRIIYANYVNQTNSEIKYDSIINLMALKLSNYGEYSQTKIWEWEKLNTQL